MEKDFVGDLYHIVIYDQIDDDSDNEMGQCIQAWTK